MEPDNPFAAPLARCPCAVNILDDHTWKPFREIFLALSYLLTDFSPIKVFVPQLNESGRKWEEEESGSQTRTPVTG